MNRIKTSSINKKGGDLDSMFGVGMMICFALEAMRDWGVAHDELLFANKAWIGIVTKAMRKKEKTNGARNLKVREKYSFYLDDLD